MTITAPSSVLNPSTTATTNGGTNNVTKTTVDVPPGSLFIGSFGGAVNEKFTSISDSAGNKYTLTQSTTGPVTFQALAWTFVSKDMPIGTSFTAATATSGAWSFDGGWKVAGVGYGSDFTGTGTNSSTLILTLTQAINKSPWGSRIIFGQTALTNSTGPFTESVGFTNLQGAGGGAGGIGYQIASATTSTTYKPTWTGASAACWQTVSFLANAPNPRPKVVRAVRRGFS